MDFASGRTSGDGMEFVDSTQSDRNKFPQKNTQSDNVRHNDSSAQNPSTSNQKSIPGATSIYRGDDDLSKSVKLPSIIPQGKQFYLVPHLVNTKKSFSLKNKAPKFVPFEPYKAAVRKKIFFLFHKVYIL